MVFSIRIRRWQFVILVIDMKIIEYCLFVLIALVFEACVKDSICYDVPLNLSRHDADSVQLKLNGFYYGNPFQTFEGDTYYNLIVFYKNGIVLSPGAAEEGHFESQIDFISENIDIISTSNQSHYGVFQIHGSEILLEKWRFGQCGHDVDLFEGEIVSDTVFKFNKLTTETETRVITEEIDHTYIFHAYSPKPDSLNSFID